MSADSAKRDIFENWTIAFIVDVVEFKQGSVTQLSLNFDSTFFLLYTWMLLF